MTGMLLLSSRVCMTWSGASPLDAVRLWDLAAVFADPPLPAALSSWSLAGLEAGVWADQRPCPTSIFSLQDVGLPRDSTLLAVGRHPESDGREVWAITKRSVIRLVHGLDAPSLHVHV